MVTKITPFIRQLSEDDRAAAKSSFQLGRVSTFHGGSFNSENTVQSMTATSTDHVTTTLNPKP
jgi:hypothetical protein